MTVLWTVIPLFDGWATRYLTAGPTFDLWPNNLKFSGQYLISQAGPIFLASGAAIATWLSVSRRSRPTSPSDPRSVADFSRYAGLFAWIVIGIVVFDLFQAFFDVGFYKRGSAGDFWAFIPENLPFFLLHSFISLVVCFVVLLYLDDGLEHLRWRTASTLGLLVLGAGLISVLYAAARVQFAFEKEFGEYGLDYAVLTAVITISAAMLAFVSAALCKRQAKVSRLRPRPTPQQSGTTVRAPGADTQTQGVGLVSPAPAGG